jgi:hypothetical protein
MPALATRLGRHAHILRADAPLSNDQIRAVAPSIFADGKHESRSDRYSFIPTSDVLAGLRKEGFEPFMVAQTRVRDEGKREHTKHMLRLRHASQITGAEANEIILLNSHDGTSAYQELAGQFRFVCLNGMVCGDTAGDIRVPHKGNVVERVIAGAYEVLDGFTRVVEEREGMKAIALSTAEQSAFARAALELKYDISTAPAPVTENQLLETRRFADRGNDLWTTFNRVQENLVSGGLPARTATGKATRTRPVVGIDQNVKLNRALWVLGQEMRKLRS